MKIAIANDHRGYDLKKYIIKHMKDIEFIDLGSDSKDFSDYSKIGFKLGEYVVKNKCLGIAICGSGIGISIACNKVKGVRCGKCNSEKDAVHGRECDFINVIALAASTPLEENKNILLAYLNSRENTSDPAYAKRAKDLEEYENRNI